MAQVLEGRIGQAADMFGLPPTIPLTILIEGAALWAVLKFDRLLVAACVVLNLLTQLGLIWALVAFYPHYWPVLAVGEVLVVLVEAAGYAWVGRGVHPVFRWGERPVRLDARNALLLSLGLNLVSFLAGLIIPV